MVSTLPKVDVIGRVMIPKHVRDAFGIEPGDLVELVVKRRIAGRTDKYYKKFIFIIRYISSIL
jgi:AbrB family looped-hinge helix DNA binding protein